MDTSFEAEGCNWVDAAPDGFVAAAFHAQAPLVRGLARNSDSLLHALLIYEPLLHLVK
jgi:hypothetical protein